MYWAFPAQRGSHRAATPVCIAEWPPADRPGQARSRNRQEQSNRRRQPAREGFSSLPPFLQECAEYPEYQGCGSDFLGHPESLTRGPCVRPEAAVLATHSNSIRLSEPEIGQPLTPRTGRLDDPSGNVAVYHTPLRGRIPLCTDFRPMPRLDWNLRARQWPRPVADQDAAPRRNRGNAGTTAAR